MRVHLLPLSTFFALTLQAQSPYRPFPEGNAGWVEQHGWLQPGPNDFVANTSLRTIRFGADTVIDAVTYHQLYTRGQGTWQTTSIPMSYGTFTEPDRRFVLFRQDVAARQVFAYDTVAHAEKIWFDFTLGLGPYPETYDTWGDQHIEVMALDSMQLSDGYHRTWVLGLRFDELVQDSAYCTIIEGVGSTFGLHTITGLVPPFEWHDALFCHVADGVERYSIWDQECDLSMGVSATRPSFERLIVSPDPTTGPIRFRDPLPAAAHCKVFDTGGRVRHEGRVQNNEMDLGHLAAGLYFLQVSDAAGSPIGTTRVVKE